MNLNLRDLCDLLRTLCYEAASPCKRELNIGQNNDDKKTSEGCEHGAFNVGTSNPLM